MPQLPRRLLRKLPSLQRRMRMVRFAAILLRLAGRRLRGEECVKRITNREAASMVAGGEAPRDAASGGTNRQPATRRLRLLLLPLSSGTGPRRRSARDGASSAECAMWGTHYGSHTRWSGIVVDGMGRHS